MISLLFETGLGLKNILVIKINDIGPDYLLFNKNRIVLSRPLIKRINEYTKSESKDNNLLTLKPKSLTKERVIQIINKYGKEMKEASRNIIFCINYLNSTLTFL